MLSCNQNTAPTSAPATAALEDIAIVAVRFALAACAELMRRGELVHAANALDFAIDATLEIDDLAVAARALELVEALAVVGVSREVP